MFFEKESQFLAQFSENLVIFVPFVYLRKRVKQLSSFYIDVIRSTPLIKEFLSSESSGVPAFQNFVLPDTFFSFNLL